LLLEELGLEYKPMPLDMMEARAHKKPEYLELNPNGKVPCLVDGDFVIWESISINNYLADKYKPELLGTTVEDRARAHQWSVWAMTELQPPLVDLLIQMLFVPVEKRDESVIAKAKERIPGLLGILDRALAGRTFMAGDALTVADFNLASVVNMTTGLKIDLGAHPNIGLWFARIKERSSFRKFAELRKP